jgi:hypothetical protein
MELAEGEEERERRRAGCDNEVARGSRTERATRALRDSGVSGREDKDRERCTVGWFDVGAFVPFRRPSYIIIVMKYIFIINQVGDINVNKNKLI